MSAVGAQTEQLAAMIQDADSVIALTGAFDALVTQNIDRLLDKAGTRELIEIHGTIGRSSCLVCGARYVLPDVRERCDRDRAGVPRCDCGAPLKPDVVARGPPGRPAAGRSPRQLVATSR